MVLGFHLLLMRMIQGLDSCWNSGVEIVRPGLVGLLEYQPLSASTDNFSVKQWEAVAIQTAFKLVRQVRNFVKRWAVLGTTRYNSLQNRQAQHRMCNGRDLHLYAPKLDRYT
jgi:hypothetical protein